MKVLERKNENHQEIFKVEMEKAEIDNALEAAYDQLVKEVNVDGFRKGKAPREVLESQVGKDAIFDQAMKHALPDLIDNMLVEHKVRAYSVPRVRLTSREPVVFEAIVPLPPDIILGDYNSIKMKPKPVVVDDRAVNELLERAQYQVGDWEVTGVPAELKDMVIAEIESDIEGEPYVMEKDGNFQLMPGWSFPAPGFSEEIVGLKVGDERDFHLKMPENFQDKTKAGKDVHFKVKIKDIRRQKLPELNDEFAQKVAPGSGGIEKLRQVVKADLERQAQDNENNAFEERAIDALVEKSQIEYPPLLVDNEVERLLKEYVDRVRNKTQNEEEFFSVLNMTPEEKLRETYRPVAEQRVKRNLVISKLIEAEKLEVGDPEVDLQIAAITAEAGDKLAEQISYFNRPENRDTLRWWLTMRKAKKLLVDKTQAD